jgi:hypothetical protein
MNLGLQKADAFLEDFTLQALWYERALRLIDGARDLPRRLVEPPGSGAE